MPRSGGGSILRISLWDFNFSDSRYLNRSGSFALGKGKDNVPGKSLFGIEIGTSGRDNNIDAGIAINKHRFSNYISGAQYKSFIIKSALLFRLVCNCNIDPYQRFIGMVL